MKQTYSERFDRWVSASPLRFGLFLLGIYVISASIVITLVAWLAAWILSLF